MWGDGTRTQDVMLVDEQVSPALTLTLTNLALTKPSPCSPDLTLAHEPALTNL